MKPKKLARKIAKFGIPKIQLAKEMGVHFQDLLDFERMAATNVFDRIKVYFEREKDEQIDRLDEID